MTIVNEMISQIKSWASPKPAIHRGEETPFLLSCHISKIPASKEAISEVDVGPDLEIFWSISAEADLFKDEMYGQWGLKILSPTEVIGISNQERKEYPQDMKETDYVIGTFYGDTDQLIVDSSAEDYTKYTIFVRNIIDERKDWINVAPSFGVFLRDYINSEGEKFWED